MPTKRNYEMPRPLGEKKEEEKKRSQKGGPTKKSNPYVTEQFHKNLMDNAQKPSNQYANREKVPEPKEREEQNKVLSNQQMVEKILQIQKMALDNAPYYLQLTYCETNFMHRFVHFEVDIDYIEQFEPILNEYIESLKAAENDAIMHYHLQEMPTKKQLENLDPKQLVHKAVKKQPMKKKTKKPKN